MSDAAPIIFIVDDDPSVRTALARLLLSFGMAARAFDSAEAFLEHARPDAPACAIIDIHLPGLSGLDIQRSLSAAGSRLPLIFLTGQGDIPTAVRAMKGGAADFLTKPFGDEELLAAVRRAVHLDEGARRLAADVDEIRGRAASLSPREGEVLALVVAGLPNKNIGNRLGVKEKTIKVHRGQVMRKMRADSLADLVRMAERIGVGG
jgi:FixJ family two-component response regulator